MDTTGLPGGAKGVLGWLLGGGRAAPAETLFTWFMGCLLRGLIILAPVVMLMMLLGRFGSVGRADAGDLVVVSVIAYVFALVPAVTGAAVYLPMVGCAVRRWPRAGRAIALACTPIVALGVVPWGMERMLLVWNVGVAVAAGLVFWAATLPLPAVVREAA